MRVIDTKVNGKLNSEMGGAYKYIQTGPGMKAIGILGKDKDSEERSTWKETSTPASI